VPKQKKRTKAAIISEMTDIIVQHLDSMPPEERQQKISASKKGLAARPEDAHPRASTTSPKQQKTHPS
jgi:hypothetical protein